MNEAVNNSKKTLKINILKNCLKIKQLILFVFLIFFLLTLCLTIKFYLTPFKPIAKTSLAIFKGAAHVHSLYSHDATQTINNISQDAYQAGLQFIILNDHNTRMESPRYEHQVLVIPQAELSTQAGHILYLDPNNTEPLRDETRHLHSNFKYSLTDQILSIAAHPYSRYTPFDTDYLNMTHGYEVLSSSSDFYNILYSWRLLFFLGYYGNSPFALTALYSKRDRSVDAYQQVLNQRPYLLFCGTDDHGFIQHPARLKTYEIYLPTFIPEKTALTDSQQVIKILKEGQYFCALGLLGDASALSISLHHENLILPLGTRAKIPSTLHVHWNNKDIPKGYKVVVYHQGQVFFTSHDSHIKQVLNEIGNYRVEISIEIPDLLFGTRELTFIYTNPFYLEPEIL